MFTEQFEQISNTDRYIEYAKYLKWSENKSKFKLLISWFKNAITYGKRGRWTAASAWSGKLHKKTRKSRLISGVN